MKKLKKEGQSLLGIVIIAGSFGLTLLSSIVVGVFLGKWVDQYFNCAPWGLLFFSLLGAVAGFWSLCKKAINKDD